MYACYFYEVRTTFLLKEYMILMFLMNALPTDQPTNQPTDTAYYRDARTHLKTCIADSSLLIASTCLNHF